MSAAATPSTKSAPFAFARRSRISLYVALAMFWTENAERCGCGSSRSSPDHTWPAWCCPPRVRARSWRAGPWRCQPLAIAQIRCGSPSGRQHTGAAATVAGMSDQLGQVTLDAAEGERWRVCSARLKTWQATRSTAAITRTGWTVEIEQHPGGTKVPPVASQIARTPLASRSQTRDYGIWPVAVGTLAVQYGSLVCSCGVGPSRDWAYDHQCGIDGAR